MQYSIKAISRIVSEFPKLKYKIVGDGLLRKMLEGMVKKLNLNEHVFFLGYLGLDEIHDLYEESDIFLLSSVTSRDGDQDGTPTVIMQAQAMQLPIIATNYAGNPEVVENQVSGILTREKDVDGLVVALKKLISSQNLRIKMGVEGRKIIVQHFNKNILNKRLLAIYNDLIKR